MAEWWQGICDQFVKCFIREDRYMLLLDGIGVTIKVTILALIIGLILGFLIALCNLSKNKLLKSIGGIYTDVIRGTPSVTQLMIIYFVVFASIHWAKWVIAAIAAPCFWAVAGVLPLLFPSIGIKIMGILNKNK